MFMVGLCLCVEFVSCLTFCGFGVLCRFREMVFGVIFCADLSFVVFSFVFSLVVLWFGLSLVVLDFGFSLVVLGLGFSLVVCDFGLFSCFAGFVFSVYLELDSDVLKGEP